MKKELLFAAASAMILAACSSDKGKVTIQLPNDFKDENIVVSHILLDNMFSAKSADEVNLMYDTLKVENGMATLTLDPMAPAWYNVLPSEASMQQVEFYATPDDNLKVDIKKLSPLDYTVTGSKLMEDVMAYYAATTPIQLEYAEYIKTHEVISPEEAKAIMDRYDDAVKKYIAENPNSLALPFALTELSGDDFKVLYDKMTPEAKKSILMPYAESYNAEVEKMLQERNAEEARKAEVASGTIDAPGFTLTDLNGKKVSLSDFRGKWVVLDFWGSWCGWCIKGFPALKEAYKQYGDKIVIIGIDCNDSDADWREAVKKYELPWLQLYNGYDKELYEAYNIEGFPTKAIINPEGKLVDLTTGEDPSFFTRLAEFVK